MRRNRTRNSLREKVGATFGPDKEVRVYCTRQGELTPDSAQRSRRNAAFSALHAQIGRRPPTIHGLALASPEIPPEKSKVRTTSGNRTTPWKCIPHSRLSAAWQRSTAVLTSLMDGPLSLKRASEQPNEPVGPARRIAKR
eukprot:CAMPEP_0181249052 /NCGR_PEP_ID=MMETSP1096-20121128/45532_1 /TAXON_ID=156174 ORGANISM="Chrysochromulina ericina, Strain CCMP281" /NCGR_SAMPLE_ID=MMETSP1096 /ASSEMBLY_ACC=CAM_ASM_000453 /LENGTH=139 /DNA_ID=CAMNT_0023346331 /DNA_START=211 /DNA_END=632 /DNA_ORIENTATION=-